MKYIVPITEANKSQIQNIKCLNALISQEIERIKFLKDAPKTPTGRLTKATQSEIDSREANINNLKEQRMEFLNAIKTDIHDFISEKATKRTLELLSDDNQFVRVLKKAYLSYVPESIMDSETKQWHLSVTSDWSGYISINLNSNDSRHSFGDYSIKRSSRERTENKYNVDEWIAQFEFKLTEAGLEFKTSTMDSYSLFNTQVDNLTASDANALITLLGELIKVQNKLNSESDLGSLNLLSNTYLWVEKVFDI